MAPLPTSLHAVEEAPKKRKSLPVYQRKHIALKKTMIAGYKAERGCRDCGESDPRCLDLHHVDPEQKSPKLHHSKRGLAWCKLPWDEIPPELEKCIVLCANCHRKHHAPAV